MRAHERTVARDDAHGVEVRFARDPEQIEAAVALLDAVEARVEAPLVDEAERARLDDVARWDRDPADHWHPLVAWSGEHPIGYASLSLDVEGSRAVGDLVVGAPAVTEVLLAGLRSVAEDHGSATAEVWARHVDADFVDVAGRAGWRIERRLWVLGRSIQGPDAPAAPVLPDGLRLDHHDGTHADDEAVAALLAAAYAGTADAGWDAAEVARRRRYDWFDPGDLLVARDGASGALRGVHWTKRRNERVGEVYNLAVAPDARGQGLGVALLDAGLAHLAEAGLQRVVLWVDEANEAGRRLYASRGFTEQWQDVALACDVC